MEGDINNKKEQIDIHDVNKRSSDLFSSMD